MHSYKILGLLLTYPNREIWRAADEWREILSSEALLPSSVMSSLSDFLQNCRASAHDENNENDGRGFLSAESDYVAVFDRNRAHSLHLLEHVYGESRERGQAMVDLAQTYESVGLHIKPGELPDYLPLFLEYLSHMEASQAAETLGEAVDVIAALAIRLHKVESPYATVLDAVVALSKVKPHKTALRKALQAAPKQPQDLRELDEEWQEKEAFAKDAHDGCSTCAPLTNFNRLLEDIPLSADSKNRR